MDMMWSRCLSRAARRIANDILLGLYTVPEILDSMPVETSGTIDVDYNEIYPEIREAEPETDEDADMIDEVD